MDEPTPSGPRNTGGKLIRFDTTSHLSNLNLISFARVSGPSRVRFQRIERTTGKIQILLPVSGPDIPGGVVLSGHTDVVRVTGQDWSEAILSWLDTRMVEAPNGIRARHGRHEGLYRGFLPSVPEPVGAN